MHVHDLCASKTWRRPMTWSTIQGLEASVVSCAHQLEDWSYGLSASAIWQWLWPMQIHQTTKVKRKRHRPGNTNRGLPHWSNFVQIVQATTGIDTTHQPSDMHIIERSSSFAFPHLPWPAHNDKSVYRCRMLPANIIRSLHTLLC